MLSIKITIRRVGCGLLLATVLLLVGIVVAFNAHLEFLDQERQLAEREIAFKAVKELVEDSLQRRFASSQHVQMVSHDVGYTSLEAVIPHFESLVNQVELVYQLASKSGIVIPQSGFKVSDQAKPIRRVQFDIPLIATYPKIKRFVSAMEAHIPNISIDRLSLRRSSVVKEELQARISLSLWLRSPRLANADVYAETFKDYETP